MLICSHGGHCFPRADIDGVSRKVLQGEVHLAHSRGVRHSGRWWGPVLAETLRVGINDVAPTLDSMLHILTRALSRWCTAISRGSHTGHASGSCATIAVGETIVSPSAVASATAAPYFRTTTRRYSDPSSANDIHSNPASFHNPTSPAQTCPFQLSIISSARTAPNLSSLVTTARDTAARTAAATAAALRIPQVVRARPSRCRPSIARSSSWSGMADAGRHAC